MTELKCSAEYSDDITSHVSFFFPLRMKYFSRHFADQYFVFILKALSQRRASKSMSCNISSSAQW